MSKAFAQTVAVSEDICFILRMKYWWVNHNQTHRTEIPGGFLWSPKTRSDGGRNQFYENMRNVAVGDVVFSFYDTLIQAVGIASAPAETAPKPDFGKAGETWANEGWLVNVEFKLLGNRIRPKDHIELIRPYLPEKYSPLQSTGDGLQSVYLAEVPTPMAQALIELIGPSYQSAVQQLLDAADPHIAADDAAEENLKGRTDIGPTSKEQLSKARRGQGVFKANVRLNESACRVTGVTDPSHLIASHIKPWRDSTDEERLHGCNGLLLAPHVDHLFDMGMISFADSGELIISSKLDPDLVEAWSMRARVPAKRFSTEQAAFLQYHREHIFKR